MTTTVIFGPPGTGKTSRLMSELDMVLASGIPPERIAFVSFTKAAVGEAIARATKQFNYGRKSFPWFRTLHSMCYSALRLDREAMLTDYSHFASGSGLRFSRGIGEGSLSALASEGDQFLAARSLMMATGLSYAEVQKKYGVTLGPFRFDRIAAALDSYKRQMDRIEYHDLFTLFMKNCDPIDVDVAFIDEAQDLTPTQWRVVEYAFSKVPLRFIAGDDDQAIFEWAGADPLHMLSVPGQRIVLDKSYRLSKEHVALAQSISARIRHRQPKDWRSSEPDRTGRVSQWFTWHDIPFNADESWMILARVNHLLGDLAMELEARGIAYSWYGESRVRPHHAKAYTTYRKLMAGDGVKGADVLRLLDDSGNVRPLGLRPTSITTINAPGMRDVRWLSKWPRQRLQYLERVWARYGRVCDIPANVTLTTIHQAKGTEAHNVILCPEQTPAAGSRRDDAEHRVWYVAVTRCKSRLFVLKPNSEHWYRVL